MIDIRTLVLYNIFINSNAMLIYVVNKKKEQFFCVNTTKIQQNNLE